ncbi:MAG: tetratricopeptide repeat protein [Spirochaetaceae bacterium]|nr:tetratricopeptide repeat protein [Spirochaetaceae bacterium]
MSNNLTRAEKKFKQGNYSDVISLLQPEVFKYRENEEFYYYLGMSCLFLGDFNGANSYLRRALQIKPNSNQMLGLAVIHLKHGNLSDAIKIWLDILDEDPENKYAKRSLDILNRSETVKKIPEDFLAKNLHKFLPHLQKAKFYNIFRYASIIFITLTILTTLFLTSKYVITNINNSKKLYPELTISRNLNDIVTTGDFKIELQAREIVALFESAKKYFIDKKDNEAMIAINKLLNSNASESVKEKARLLDTYLKEPDFRYFKNSITYKMASENPYLYNNCFVKWSGKIANIRIFEKSASFDFLIGYDSGRIVEGIISVTIDSPIVLNEEFSYDIIGQLKTEENNLTLKAITLRNY